MSYTKGPWEWVTYNHLTSAYDAGDGASVAAELSDNVQCLADLVRIAQIRAERRAAIEKATKP